MKGNVNIDIRISKIHEKILMDYISYDYPYGNRVKHIKFESWNVEDNEFDSFILARMALVEFGILSIYEPTVTSRYYKITELGELLIDKIKSSN